MEHNTHNPAETRHTDDSASGSGQIPDSDSIASMTDEHWARCLGRFQRDAMIRAQVHYWQKYGPTVNYDLPHEDWLEAKAIASSRGILVSDYVAPAKAPDATPAVDASEDLKVEFFGRGFPLR
jgi:hypothetical protein